MAELGARKLTFSSYLSFVLKPVSDDLLGHSFPLQARPSFVAKLGELFPSLLIRILILVE